MVILLLCELHDMNELRDKDLWYIKLVNLELNPDRGQVVVIYGGRLSWQDHLERDPVGRYSPQSHKYRFVVPLT